MCSVFTAFTDVTINADQTAPVLLGTPPNNGGGTATIASGVTVETTGGLPPFAVEVIEAAPSDSWTIDNYGTLLANSDNSVDCYTEATVNNYGTISSGNGSGVAAVFSDDSIIMDLNNSSSGFIDGTGVGVLFDFYGVGNTGSINNQGTIEGGTIGVTVAGGGTALTNSGTISGLDGPGVVMGGSGDTASYTLTNSGTIIGNDVLNIAVSMGEGDDTVELKTGTQIINGDIDGGEILADTDTDTLILNGSGSVSWNNYWFENLEKTGSGRWTLETDLDLGAGGTTVITTGDLGLNLNITLTSSSGVTVNSPAVFSGDGFITGSITNNGTISPGNGSGSPFGTLDVTGDVTFGAGSTMAVDIGALGTRDLLNVSATATVDGTIQVNEVTAIPGGEVIDIITATSLVNLLVGPPQQGVSLVVTFSQNILGNNLRISTARDPYSDWAATENQWQVAEALYDSVGLSTGDLGRVLAHLDFLPLQEDLQNAFEELQPKPYFAHPSLVKQEADFFGANLSGRMRDRRQHLVDAELEGGAQPENNTMSVAKGGFIPEPLDYTADVSHPISMSEKLSSWNTYVQTYALWAEEKADASIDGLGAATFGAFFGSDRPIGQSLIGGFCLGTGVTHTETAVSGSSGNKLSLRVGPYLSYFRDGLVLEGSVTGGVNWLSTRRPIDITGLSRVAKGSYDSYDLALELAALYELEFWGFTLKPQIRLMYDYIYLDDFTETGADSIGLVVFERKVHSLNHMVGGRLGYDINFAKSSLRPEAWAAWTHKYFADDQAVQAGLVGAPQNDFTISAPGTPQEVLQWGAGVSLSLVGAFSGYLHYQAAIYQDTWDHSVRGGVQIPF